MNIFDIYINKIKKIVVDQKSKNLLIAPENLEAINVDIPPKHFDCDISSNVAMVLSKINKKSPIYKSIENHISNSIIATTKIEGLPHSESGSILVDAAEFFLKDFQYLKLPVKLHLILLLLIYNIYYYHSYF